MEEVLDILNQPADERAPVVALDERPVQLLDAARPGTPMAPGKVAHRDYEYVCCGTANVFCVVDPLRWSVNIFKKHHKLIVYYKGRMFKRRFILNGIFEMWGHPVAVACSADVRDAAVAARLWQVSKQLTGVHYTL